MTFASSTHVAIVEVDPDTSLVRVLRYVVVDDCGRPINPAVVDGQVQGGVVHGIGNGLFEEAIYDSEGQFLNASLSDYLLPTAADVPFVEVAHDNHPTSLNSLGVKGVGEGGTTSAPAAIANAVSDTLGVQVTELPMTPARLRELTAER